MPECAETAAATPCVGGCLQAACCGYKGMPFEHCPRCSHNNACWLLANCLRIPQVLFGSEVEHNVLRNFTAKRLAKAVGGSVHAAAAIAWAVRLAYLLSILASFPLQARQLRWLGSGARAPFSCLWHVCMFMVRANKQCGGGGLVSDRLLLLRGTYPAKGGDRKRCRGAVLKGIQEGAVVGEG